MRIAVIGSGPAGIACARALARRGVVPTVIDVGEGLPGPRQALVDRLAALSPEQWSDADRHALTENSTFGRDRIPQKMVFGADFHFARERAFGRTVSTPPLPTATLARGGYSVAWGAAVLPAHQSDIASWPITNEDLEGSYRRVMAETPLSAARDALEHDFPLYTSTLTPLPLAEDARALLADLERLVVKGGNAPFLCGQARLAVDAAKCRTCGTCLSGCVYGAIHSLEPQIEKLQKEGKIVYRSELYVEELDEKADGVSILARSTRTNEIQKQQFDHVFLAAGAIETTRIALTSLGLYNQPVVMKTSQIFVLPLLRLKRSALEWPRSVSLASLFLDFKVPDISDNWVHAQVTSTNDYVLRGLGIAPWHGTVRKSLLAPFFERLSVLWCGLHSDHSPGIALELERGTDGRSMLNMRELSEPDPGPAARLVARHLARFAAQCRSMIPVWAMRMSSAGGGNHIGGTLPMHERPRGPLDTDRLGRLAPYKRTHVVDGSVLPSLPSTTLVLLQMANADRIASRVQFDS